MHRTAYGLDAEALRPLADGSTYVRTTKYLMPFISLVPGQAGTDAPGVIFITSPVDDTHHTLFSGCWSDSVDIVGPGQPIPRSQLSTVGDSALDPHDYGGFSGGREDNWGQDRQAMAEGHFSGFTGNLIQEDTVTQASMGPIVDRTKEHLSSSDVAIIHARRMLLEALQAVAEGRLPPGAGDGVDHRHVVPVDEVVPPPARADLAHMPA